MASGSSPTELPQFYGGKTADGETVRRPEEETTLAIVKSPARVYDQKRHLSPDRVASYDSTDQDIRSSGLRRRTSPRPGESQRRHSNAGDYDRPSYAISRESQRILRARDDGYYRDRDEDHDYDRPLRRQSRNRDRDRDDLAYNPDRYEGRSRPPRSHRNQELFDRDGPRPSKHIHEETRGDYEDRGPRIPRTLRAKLLDSEDESVEGYNYDGHNNKDKRTTIDFKNLTREQQKEVMRLPWTQWMGSSFKNHFVATIGEFVGTTMFLFFAFSGTQVANINSSANNSNPTTANTTSGGATGFDVSVLLYIALIFGFSLMVNVWIFFRISGGLFNPAVTLAMVLTGALPAARALCLFFAQMTGGVAASAIVLVLFPTPLNVRTTLAGGASIVQGVFIEAILTAELVFTIFMLAKEKHKATFIAPVGIGLALFIAEMVGVYYTGGSLNPARSFGPCAVTATFDPEHWIYWVGPILGSLIAVFFYKFIKMLEYEMANPGQDGDVGNDPTKNKEKFVEMRSESGARHH